MPYLLRVERIDADTWEIYINGDQQGQYPTLALAKAAARRRMHSTTPRLVWRQVPSETEAWETKVQ